MLARYSNDRFRATPHRVINRNDASRYAIPFSLGPNHDSIVDCVPICVGPRQPAALRADATRHVHQQQRDHP
jgi:isopenicillin N synthase-like dioxygenase